jgi:hypothetical protein
MRKDVASASSRIAIAFSSPPTSSNDVVSDDMSLASLCGPAAGLHTLSYQRAISRLSSSTNCPDKLSLSWDDSHIEQP